VQRRRRDADSPLSPLQRPEVSRQFPDLWLAQLFSERWHLAFNSGGNHLTNAGVAPVEIMQIRPLVAARSTRTRSLLQTTEEIGS